MQTTNNCCLDQADFQSLYRLDASDEFDYVFAIEGMHCSSCVNLLEKLPELDAQIQTARVNFAQRHLYVKLQDGASLSKAAETIKGLGYTPTLINRKDNDKENELIRENRSHIIKIAVAGFCAGNIMLFVIPVYSGMTGISRDIFNWISFALFLPILFYSATPFFQGALNSLKFRMINVDLPIVVAMLTGFILSTANLLRGDGNIYFDSTASFIFFILSARFLLRKTQTSYLSNSRAHSLFNQAHYLVQKGSEYVPTSWQSLQPGDIIKVQKGQNMPSEVELLSTFAAVDMSLFNGESLPRNFSKGMTLFAGTRLLNDEATVQILKEFSSSNLGRVFQQLEESTLGKNAFTSLTDKIAHNLIIAVFSLAILFFLFYFHVDPSEAFNRALALIVLACPCALAFGTPLTYGLAIKYAQNRGILIKNSSSLDKLLNIRNIFFDKTGTLTLGELSLAPVPQEVSVDLKRVILSLEAKSYHPIAFALRKAWPDISADLKVADFAEQLGQGVRGTIGGDIYEVRNLSESIHDSEIGIEVLKNSTGVARLYFTDCLREDSAHIVQSLLAQDYNCFLITGDRKNRALEIARACGIDEKMVSAELFPEDKKHIVENNRPCCVIGDGANDALSLQAADVGIAVQGSVDISLNSADIYFTNSGLRSLTTLLATAKKTRTVLVRNLTLSLLYNGIGATLALMGFINPMIAAILMPISSAFVILSTVWGFR